MDLKTYFTEHDGRVSRAGARLVDVAAKANTTPGYLYLIVLGHKPISPEFATALQIATDGQVSRRDLCPDFPWDEPDVGKAA
jgi:DNA-binding transcriptional regulator YdaS (Cro superfamily)